MASYINTLFLLPFLIVLNVHPFAIANTTPLNNICNHVTDRSFCLKNIGSNPGTWIAGLPLLGHTAIVKAQIAGTIANNTIHSLRVIAVDPQLKNLLAECEDSYSDALNAIRMAPNDLNSGNYRDLRLHAKQAVNAVERCESSFRSPFEALVTVENINFKNHCGILAIIADDLKAGKLGNI